MGTMKHDPKPIAFKCFRNPEVPDKSKLQLVKSLLLSRGLFSSSTWSVIAAAEHRRVHAGVMYMYRSATNTHYMDSSLPVSDQQLLHDHSRCAPLTLIRILRLSLLCRLLRKPNLPFLCMLCACAEHGKVARSILQGRDEPAQENNIPDGTTFTSNV